MKSCIIAHRGASALCDHENTIESFQIAINIGADYAEFDIRRTKDHKLIVFHNPDFDGTPICELTYATLCEKTAKENYRVPLLEEVLALCSGKIKLDIELKESGYERRVVNLVKKYYPSYNDYMMKSFIDKTVARIKELDPNIKAGLLLGKANATFRRRLHEYFPEHRLRACHADFVSPHYQLATAEFVARMHIEKKPVYIWTVNHAKTILSCIRKHADGIISDIPDAAIAIRNGSRRIDHIHFKKNIK